MARVHDGNAGGARRTGGIKNKGGGAKWTEGEKKTNKTGRFKIQFVYALSYTLRDALYTSINVPRPSVGREGGGADKKKIKNKKLFFDLRAGVNPFVHRTFLYPGAPRPIPTGGGGGDLVACSGAPR